MSLTPLWSWPRGKSKRKDKKVSFLLFLILSDTPIGKIEAAINFQPAQTGELPIANELDPECANKPQISLLDMLMEDISENEKSELADDQVVSPFHNLVCYLTG
jgi:hypothetical protein